MADLAVDEDFARNVGAGWRAEAHRTLQEASSLLERVGIELAVASTQRWESDDAEDSVVDLLDAADLQTETRAGNLLLVITDQHTVRYDGWAQDSRDRVIVRFNHERTQRNAALIAHEVGHLLGAHHHEDDEECTEGGCIMDERGFAHATEWCDHHAETIQTSIDSMLSSVGV